MKLSKWKPKKIHLGRGLVFGVPYVWLLLLFLVPFIIVLKISFADQELDIPPYTPLFINDGDMGNLAITLNYHNYVDIFTDFGKTLARIVNPFAENGGGNIYLLTYWSSIKVAFFTTVLCLLLGYP
ncbi:MAG: putrescine/spermidine ABC transporter permease, partial [Neisseriaceae bacterium]|nr:putrescine/spermidine ABC transporter permease [Neisseriaceae bacterium]